jgi:hypothetical protein
MAFSVECLTGHSARENPMRTKRFSAEVYEPGSCLTLWLR